MNVKGRIEVAPSKTLALLKFKTEEDAYKCYRSINLRRYNESVVYCEYAPVCDGGDGSDGSGEVKDKVEGMGDGKAEGTDEDNKDDHNNPNNKQDTPLKFTNKLLIKNLPFQATKSDVQRLFNGKFNFTNIRIPKKRDGNSRGFCFVELDSEKRVIEAIEYFGKSTHLYGRRLVLEKAKE
ncbi:Multiple RNA-binding domain-containing protein 1 [Nosema bombycis CQ1]|uniref:Multiple RNA-binding domain-containing protein 1 n=1 Tax=Nosema bombycis (strain CQ1 / CVCC 102059) TaxID=578461 RepID=R0KM12_NOSB1|nr:Multiple RNA-binding domain-containing protein 1 [Nosema bombycis CQ1]|eukprot:EOB11691.1 Multiple RNA-binding domain-containing protein 1 [Nosema bombycis CQ1]